MPSSGFIPLQNRDASHIIRGFLYQIELTIKRWIELDESAVLELERGEDIDIVQRAWSAQETRILEQIKLRSSSVSLRSPEILETLANFFSSFKTNQNLDLRFRYLTNAQTAVERGVDFGEKRAGLEVWNEFAAGHLRPAEAGAFLKNLREFLPKVNRPDKVRTRDWKLFRGFFQKESADLSAFVERVEWSFGNPEVTGIAMQIEAALMQTGHLSPEDVTRAHHQLLNFVITRLSSPGLKRLMRDELRAELRDVQKSSVNPVLIGMINMLLEGDSAADRLDRDLRHVLNSIGQTAGSTESLQIDPGLPRTISTIPASIVGGSQRSESVDRLVEALGQTTWVALYGDSGSGKTELARLVTERLAAPMWISFRNTARDQMSSVFDNYIASISKVAWQGDLREWYTDTCTHLSPGATFFLDDIPFDGNTDMCSKLCVLAECARGAGIKILSTAADKLLPTPGERLGTSFLEIPLPRFSEQETKEYFLNRGAPESLFAKPEFLTLVDSVTRRHPQIIAALTRHMEQNGWQYDANTIRGLIRGDFAEDLKLQTRRILASTVPENTRELLYRLNVVGPLVTHEDAARVGKILPPIALPIDKLSECVGVWIQRLTNDTFIVSPLVEQLGSANVTPDTQKLIHLEKAQSILAKKALNQFDALTAIRHFQNAGKSRDAAQVLFVALNALNELSGRNVDDFGLLEIWTNTDLPTSIPIQMQLMLRALQISTRKRRSKPFSRLLAKFDTLIDRAGKSDQLAAFGSCAMLAVTLADTDSSRALKYALSAVALEEDVKDFLPVELAGKAAEIIWVGAPHFRHPEDLVTFLESIARLPEGQASRIFASDMAAQSCRFICDRFWRGEGDKESPQWDILEMQLETIAAKAQEFKASALLSAVTRARIVVAADWQKNLAKAIALADEAMSFLQSDNRAVFLVAFTLGVSCCDLTNWDQGVGWLTKAIELKEYLYADLYVRALLTRAQALQKKGGSARSDCLRAVEFGRENQSVSELMLIRSLGEYSISLWDERDEPSFFEAWQEAIERLLAAKANTNEWKEVFVLTGNNTAWFAASEKGIAPVPNMTQPFQSMYLRYSPQLPVLYAQETDWYMPATMVWIAEKLGRYVESSRWALRATELSAGSPIGAEAKTLLLYATPQAIRQRRYSEALAFVLQAVEGRQAPTDALSAFAEQRGNEEFKKLVEERPKPKPSLTDELLAVTLVPMLIDLLAWHMADAENATDAARSIIETCQELAERSDDAEAWLRAATALDQVFSPTAILDTIVATARQHSKENKYMPALICSLGTAKLAPPEVACTHWLSTLEFYERQFSRSRLHIQLVAESANAFWRVVASKASFAFRQPTLLQQKLQEIATRPDQLLRHTMRVVVWHLGLSVAPQAKEWLDRA